MQCVWMKDIYSCVSCVYVCVRAYVRVCEYRK